MQNNKSSQKKPFLQQKQQPEKLSGLENELGNISLRKLFCTEMYWFLI